MAEAEDLGMEGNGLPEAGAETGGPATADDAADAPETGVAAFEWAETGEAWGEPDTGTPDTEEAVVGGEEVGRPA